MLTLTRPVITGPGKTSAGGTPATCWSTALSPVTSAGSTARTATSTVRPGQRGGGVSETRDT